MIAFVEAVVFKEHRIISEMAALWKESHCEGKGRILVASQNIAAGSIVLEDQCMLGDIKSHSKSKYYSPC